MERTSYRWEWIVCALLALACSTHAGGCSDPSPDAAMHVGAQRSRPRARPEGWSEASHGERSDADYARVFPDDRVQRLDIILSEETAERLKDDLDARLGPKGTPTSTPAAIEACVDHDVGEACSFLEVEGRCSNRGRLTCRGSDQEVAIDMIPGDPVMVPVTVRYDGKVWNQVGFRYKGNSSLARPWAARIEKLPFRLDFDKFEDDAPELKNQRFYGFDKLTFANGYNDPSLIREKLAVDVLRDAGLVAARAAFYRVYVDQGDGPAYWGVYTMVEDPSDVLPSARFASGSGNMYKPDGTGADFTRFDKRGFEKKSNEDEDDYGDIERALAALHAPRDDAAGWRRGMERAFDVDVFLGNLAVRNAIDHWDGYGQLAHNYYLYGDPEHGGRLVFLSWDHNSILGARARTQIMPLDTSRSWPLIRYTLADSVYLQRYRDWLAELSRGAYEKRRFDAHASRLHEMIAPYVRGDRGERAPYTHLRSGDEFEGALAPILAAADSRRQAIARALADRDPRDPRPREPVSSDDDREDSEDGRDREDSNDERGEDREDSEDGRDREGSNDARDDWAGSTDDDRDRSGGDRDDFDDERANESEERPWDDDDPEDSYDWADASWQLLAD